MSTRDDEAGAATGRGVVDALRERLDAEKQRRDIASLVFLVSQIGTLPLWGAVVAIYWSWFVVPLGLHAISYWHGLGLTFLASFMVYRLHGDDDDRRTAKWFTKATFENLTVPLTMLIFGWLTAKLAGFA